MAAVALSPPGHGPASLERAVHPFSTSVTSVSPLVLGSPSSVFQQEVLSAALKPEPSLLTLQPVSPSSYPATALPFSAPGTPLPSAPSDPAHPPSAPPPEPPVTADMPASSPDPVPSSHLPMTPPPLPSLSDISHALRLQKYHRRRCHQVKDSLLHLQIAAARTSRLVRIARSVHHTLAECVRSEDKDGFVNLLNAFLDSCDACLKPSAAPAAPPLADPLDPAPAPAQTDSHAPVPFLGELSPASQSGLLKFLAKLRYDGRFVADRIASLSHAELLALLPSDRLASSSRAESVLGSSTRSSSRTARLGWIVDAQVDLVTSQSYASALDALIFAPRGLPSDDLGAAADASDARSTSMWARVCAGLITARKPGAERLVPAILDTWATLDAWPGKERLGLWLLQTLQRASFLLEQQSGKQTFRARMDNARQDPSEDDRAESFYAHATDSLLDMLADTQGASVIPPGVLRMCDAVCAQLDDTYRRAFPPFVVARWLFSPFFFDAITLPEAHDLLTDYYISDTARQRILREVASRAQKAVLDVVYSWKHGNSTSLETIRRVQAVMARFQGSPATKPAATDVATPSPAPAHGDGPADAFLAVSISDVMQLVKALYPQRRPASCFSDLEPPPSRSGVQSSASSVSGFSLFRSNRTDSVVDAGYPSSHDASASWLSADSSLPVIGTTLEPEWFPGEHQIRNALRELEDLCTTSEEHWEILAASQSTTSVRTMPDLFTQTGPPDVPPGVGERWLPNKWFGDEPGAQACAGSVKLLLQHSNRRHNDVLSLRSQQQSLFPEQGQPADDAVSVLGQIRSLFADRIRDLEGQADFVRAHAWIVRLRDFNIHVARHADDPSDLLQNILGGIQASTHRSIARAEALADACDTWMRLLKPRSQLQTATLAPLTEVSTRLRDKLWYVTDVRTSAAYDSARCVTNALRIMGKSKVPRPRSAAPPLRHWSGPRLSYNPLPIKSDAQILDILSAKPEHGGPNKLSDDQSLATAQWIEQRDIGNLCPGEERLHKLCMEVSKCVDTVLANTPTDSNAMLWSNPLFSRDRAFPYQARTPLPRRPTLFSGLNPAQHASNSLLLHQSSLRSLDASSNASNPLSSASSRDYLDAQSPTYTNRSSAAFWSPAMTEAGSPPSSSTSVLSSLTQSALLGAPTPRRTRTRQNLHHPPVSPSRSAVDKLRQHTISLVLSDLTATLYVDGCETDRAFWTGLSSALGEKHVYTPHVKLLVQPLPAPHLFDFEAAFARLLARFSASPDPLSKLDCLHAIDKLLGPYMAERQPGAVPTAAVPTHCEGSDDDEDDDLMTDADESPYNSIPWASSTKRRDTTSDTNTSGFRALFSNSKLRPLTIFRDLQYIAALAPPWILSSTPQGRAFTRAALALTSLKEKAKIVLVETADSIIAFHSNNRGGSNSTSTSTSSPRTPRSPSSAQQQRDSQTFPPLITPPSRSPSAEEISQYTMSDAATLLVIAAKEGDPVAQRELATLYLTHPHLLMGPVIAPFTRPTDVFSADLEATWRKNSHPTRCDPVMMCAAHHWMELSCQRGDPLAKEYLRQREEMERLP